MTWTRRLLACFVLVSPVAWYSLGQPPRPTEPTLWEVGRLLKSKQFVDLDGSPLPRCRGRWSGWDWSDGGPMPPKFKAYRVNEQFARNAAMFVAWLDVREEEAA